MNPISIEDNSTTHHRRLPLPVFGEWSAWSEWAYCTVTCGGGRTNRVRTCSEDVCEGEDSERGEDKCNDFKCIPR